jgi:hypothetical protein
MDTDSNAARQRVSVRGYGLDKWGKLFIQVGGGRFGWDCGLRVVNSFSGADSIGGAVGMGFAFIYRHFATGDGADEQWTNTSGYTALLVDGIPWGGLGRYPDAPGKLQGFITMSDLPLGSHTLQAVLVTATNAFVTPVINLTFGFVGYNIRSEVRQE